MKIPIVLAFLGILLAPSMSFGEEKPVLAISKVFSEPNRETRDMVLKQGDSSIILYVDRNAAISDKDIVEATFIEGDHARIRIVFSPEGKKKLSELTKECIHKRLAIVLDDQVIMAAMIMAEITGGTLDVSGDITKELADKIIEAVKKIKNR